jgi:protein SCO1/2
MIRTSFIVGALALAAILGTSCATREQRPPAALPAVVKAAPAFSGTNFDGSTVTDAQLRGTVYLAYFFFTSCGGPCPVMNSKANVLQAEYADAADFRIVGFSVDPDNDDVPRLARYAERYNAKASRWFMLRMSADSVAALASKGFLMGDASQPALHSTRFALVDAEGNIRGYYDGMDDAKLRDLRAVLDRLLKRSAA